MALDVDITPFVQQERKCIEIASKDTPMKGRVFQLILSVQEVHHELHALKVFFQRSCQVMSKNNGIEDIFKVSLEKREHKV